MNRHSTQKLAFGPFLLAIVAGMLAGCSHNSNSVGNPGVTPPNVMQSAQQNAAAQAEWAKSHPGQMHP